MTTRAEDWEPSGVHEMEPDALAAVRDVGHGCVVAGPGSGKTELLAQKAAFLFETGLCPAPHRILAISFKTDSANNLARRVEDRCGRVASARFDSVTFDAFTKNLLDRFYPTLPEVWRPSRGYRVQQARRADFRAFISKLMAFRPHWADELSDLSLEVFEQRLLGTFSLPLTPTKARTSVECAVLNWVKAAVDETPSALSFSVINRLSRLIIESAPAVRRAMQSTYPFVFVDEFQDTTYSQYDFLTSSFSLSTSAMTVVGDNKQRIMAWAGADPDAVRTFCTQAGIDARELKFNYRSSPELVELQHSIAQELEPSSQLGVSRYEGASVADSAKLWRFGKMSTEGAKVARWVREDHSSSDRSFEDYVILVRQKPDEFEAILRPHFEAEGIRLVNHATYAATMPLQDLLKDQVARLSIDLLRLATAEAPPRIWDSVRESLLLLRQIDPIEDEVAYLDLEDELNHQVDRLRLLIADLPVDGSSADAVCEQLRLLVSDDAWKRAYWNYQDADNVERSREAFAARLRQVLEYSSNWWSVAADFGGERAVQILTVHRSKGLEFHTVISLGIDDSTWWSYKKDRKEGDAAFFVGLSRAKSRIVFSHCAERGGRNGIQPLFDFLRSAGVREEKFDC